LFCVSTAQAVFCKLANTSGVPTGSNFYNALEMLGYFKFGKNVQTQAVWIFMQIFVKSDSLQNAFADVVTPACDAQIKYLVVRWTLCYVVVIQQFKTRKSCLSGDGEAYYYFVCQRLMPGSGLF
jgi:hypothetical protein